MLEKLPAYTFPGEIVKKFAPYFSLVYVPGILEVNDEAPPRNAGENILGLRALLKSDVVQVITKLKSLSSDWITYRHTYVKIVKNICSIITFI